MTDKQIYDRLYGINMSIDQKKALIDVIKDIINNNVNTDIPVIGTINDDYHEQHDREYTHRATITPITGFIPEVGKLYKVEGLKHASIIFYFSDLDIDEGDSIYNSNILLLSETQGIIFDGPASPYICNIEYKCDRNYITKRFDARIKLL